MRKLKQGDLETLRLLTMHQGRKVPTVGGLGYEPVDREFEWLGYDLKSCDQRTGQMSHEPVSGVLQFCVNPNASCPRRS